MTPQENIEAMAADIAAVRKQLKKIYLLVQVIAIPFVLALLGFLVTCAFWVVVFVIGGQG